MTDREPTILATSGGLMRGRRTEVAFGPLLNYALELSGVDKPQLLYVGTAMGDEAGHGLRMIEAGQEAGIAVDLLRLFPMPNADDLSGYVLSHDVIWVGGGSVANLLALWRLHGLDTILTEAWRAGVVLAGVSAGSLCWHIGGTTDSFSPDLSPVTNGLALLPYSNGVHYDSEPRRRPLFQQLIADGTLPNGYATEDGTGLVYQGTRLIEAVTEIEGKTAYRVERDADEVHETAIPTRLLTNSKH
ncbi:peptidase E [Ferrimicrobium acidiphilum]|uniref:Type 1 glutamine amidotransferase-like domain-containing protein n=1 Tax=Ferrimicrobium acidiphilum TaxID=121039 RepID=UPI0023F0785A|nr:peptidase E [Ferrimicrobium acidiphilum]